MKNPQIPKIIHYCWFGRNLLPPLAEKCIASWKKYLPDYEIKEWNEDNFDVCMNTYIEEAYHLKKYAFVSDFARFYILYHHGGVYFDIDVEVIKPIDDILAKGPFMGLEKLLDGYIYNGYSALPAAGLGMAVYPKMDIVAEFLSYYNNRHFISLRGKPKYKTVVQIVSDVLCAKGAVIDVNSITICEGIYVYPKEYFAPITNTTIAITENTRSIHHYAATWIDHKAKRGLAKHWQRFNNLLLRLRLSVKRHF